MFAWLAALEPPHHYPTLLPGYIAPAEVTELATPQAVVEGQPDRGCIAIAIPVLPRCLDQLLNLVAAQVFTRPAILVLDALPLGHGPMMFCPTTSVWRAGLDQPKHRSLAHVVLLNCPKR